MMLLGTQNCHIGREVCSGLHMVRGHNTQLDPIGWRLCVRGGVVPCRSDCDQSRGCTGICC